MIEWLKDNFVAVAVLVALIHLQGRFGKIERRVRKLEGQPLTESDHDF